MTVCEDCEVRGITEYIRMPGHGSRVVRVERCPICGEVLNEYGYMKLGLRT